MHFLFIRNRTASDEVISKTLFNSMLTAICTLKKSTYLSLSSTNELWL